LIYISLSLLLGHVLDFPTNIRKKTQTVSTPNKQTNTPMLCYVDVCCLFFFINQSVYIELNISPQLLGESSYCLGFIPRADTTEVCNTGGKPV